MHTWLYMKKTKDQEQDFVLRHYTEGRFDPEAALKKLRPRPIRRRWVAAAASLLCIVAFASVLTWQLSKPKQPLPTPATESVVSTHEEPDVAHFSFNDTPLPDVLSQLGRYYGVTLETNDSTRHLTGEFSGEQLDDIIGMIEEVLSVKITRH